MATVLSKTVPRGHFTNLKWTSEKICLPFLYCTRTITRAYRREPQARIQRRSGRYEGKRNLLDEPYVPFDHPPQPGEAKRSEQRRERRTIENELTNWDEKPLPPVTRARKRDQDADLAGTTITPSERKAFANLFQIDSSFVNLRRRRRVEEPTPRPVDTTSLDTILDEAVAAAEEAPPWHDAMRRIKSSAEQRQRERQDRSDRNRSPRSTQRDPNSQAAVVQRIADIKYQDFRRALEGAKTDVEVWELMIEKVVQPVLSLRFDRNVEAVVDRKEEITKPDDHSAKAEPQKPDDVDAPFGGSENGEGETQDSNLKTLVPNIPPENWGTLSPNDPSTTLQILASSFPILLSLVYKHLTSSFPASPLLLTLLPYIRSLGPQISALALSTRIYNLHMRALWLHSHDLASIILTLEEMEKGVYEFDYVTHVLLLEIVTWIERALRGEYGDSARVVWSMDANVRARRAVRRWLKLVRRRREESALRRAREVDDLNAGFDEVEERKGAAV